MSEQPHLGSEQPSLLLLVLLTSIGPFAMNVAIPLMPVLAQNFGTSYALIQLTLTAYLVATAVATLFLGPMSDRFGRKPVLIVGLVIFVAGSFVCAIAPSAVILVVGRAIQAVGGAAGWVLTRAIIHDVYGPRRAASLIGYVTMAMVLAPMIAPAAGGYMDAIVGWRFAFWLLVVVSSALAFATVKRLPETKDFTDNPAQSVGHANRTALLRVPAFWGYSANLGFGSGMFFAFIAGAPFVVVEIMGFSAESYGHYFVLISFGYMFGNFLSGRFSDRLGSNRMIIAGCVTAFVGLSGLWLLRGLAEPVAMFLPMAIIAISNGMTLPNATASAMSIKPELAGTASGVAGFLQLTVGAFITVVVGALMTDSSLPMIATMTLSGLFSALGILVALGPRSRGGVTGSRRTA